MAAAENLLTPKQRMLRAYQGLPVDTIPVAPEFWCYYPAKVLGVDMITFQKEVPFWEALQTTFSRFGTEGWGVVFPQCENPDTESRSTEKKIAEGRFRETTVARFRKRRFVSRRVLDVREPSATEKYPVDDPKDLELYFDMRLSPRIAFDYTEMKKALRAVGEDYLLEFWLGAPFFDFVSGAMGFEPAVLFFMTENDDRLARLRRGFTEFQKELVRSACRETEFESFCIGCSASCNSLAGPALWRKWDKPYLREIIGEVHRHGRLVHVHFHGKSKETLEDFAELGMDCVCPFERPPGGDISGLEGLREVRRKLADRVTVNGNVHTVETLIRGNPADVRREVREIKQAFAGSSRLIIGTGDQVGGETPEENIAAMVDEARAG